MADSIIFRGAALRELLLSPEGPIADDLRRRARRVKEDARRRCPVDTGRLQKSITDEIRRDAVGLVARVGTNVEYARAVHDGTGIYGPKGAPIARVSKKGKTYFVQGQKGQPFLKDALPAGTNP